MCLIARVCVYVCILLLPPHRSANFSNLTGANAIVSTYTHINGKAPVGGTFQMTFRGIGPSYPIPFNADMYSVRDALETVKTIDAVEVCVCRTFLCASVSVWVAGVLLLGLLSHEPGVCVCAWSSPCPGVHPLRVWYP